MTHIQIQQADGVLRLTLDRPEKKNALIGTMYDTLSAELARAGETDAIRAVVLCGAGAAFSSGNDVADFMRRGAISAHEAPSVGFIRALARFEKPLLAAVNGLAVGIGTTMLLHCDLVLASPDASFSTPFARLGLVPEAGSSLLLPRRIGPLRANAMLLLGESLNAEQALAAGLINAVVPADALLDQTLRLAARLAALPAVSLRASKTLVAGDRAQLDAVIDAELAAFDLALRSDEARAAFAAFLDRPRSS